MQHEHYNKKDIRANISKHVEKVELSCAAGDNIKCTVTLENTLAVPQKVKTSYHITHQFYSYVYFPREMKMYAHMQTCT